MPKYLITLCLLVFLASPAWTQDEEAAGETADTEETEAEDATLEEAVEDPEEEEDVDDSDLDEQTYEEDDDGFIPTEEIPADEPIPFPSNI
jgi:hypothetical protein